MPVFCSMVCCSSFGPPYANAALILVVPCPGTSTIESRGMDISRFGPEPVCSSMIVSVRRPSPLPTPYLSCCFRVSPSRESLPTRRYVVPDCAEGRSPLGVESTLSIFDQASSGTAIRNTSQSASTTLSHRSRGRRRLREGPDGGGAAGRRARSPPPEPPEPPPRERAGGGGVSKGPPEGDLRPLGRSTVGSIRVG